MIYHIRWILLNAAETIHLKHLGYPRPPARHARCLPTMRTCKPRCFNALAIPKFGDMEYVHLIHQNWRKAYKGKPIDHRLP